MVEKWNARRAPHHVARMLKGFLKTVVDIDIHSQFSLYYPKNILNKCTIKAVIDDMIIHINTIFL